MIKKSRVSKFPRSMYLPHAYLLHHFVGLLHRQRVVGQMLLALEFTLLLSQPQKLLSIFIFLFNCQFSFHCRCLFGGSPQHPGPVDLLVMDSVSIRKLPCWMMYFLKLEFRSLWATSNVIPCFSHVHTSMFGLCDCSFEINQLLSVLRVISLALAKGVLF